MAGTFEDWYRNLPTFTRILFVLSALLTVTVHWLGLAKWSDLAFDLKNVLSPNYEIWRPFTALTYLGPFSLSFVLHMYMLLYFSSKLEGNFYRGRTADYMLFLAFGGLSTLAIGHYLQQPIMSHSFILMIVYVFCQVYPNVIMSLFFGLQVPAQYMPFVLVGLNLILGQSITLDVVGIVVGHTYHVIANRQGFLRAPQWLRKCFMDEVQPVYAAAPPAGEQNAPQQPAQSGQDDMYRYYDNQVYEVPQDRPTAAQGPPPPGFETHRPASRAAAPQAESTQGYWSKFSGGRKLGHK